LVAWKSGNLWRWEPVDDDMTGFIVSAQYNTQSTLSGVAVIIMACVKCIVINHPIIENPFTMNAVKTAQIHSSWYEEIAWIDPAQRRSDLPRAYISVVNESSQQLFRLLTLYLRLSRR